MALGLASPPPRSLAADPAPAVAIAQPAIDIEGFLRRHEQEYIAILDHPQVACLLKQLPKERLDAVAFVMHRNKAADTLEERDAEGGFTFQGWLEGAGCQRALLWIHPDGRVVAGDVDCERFLAWTNDPALVQRLPDAVHSWLSEGAGAMPGTSIAWVGKTPSKRMPASCMAGALARELDAHERRLFGTLCDGKVRSDRDVAAVRPRAGSTSPLARPGRPCVADAPRDKKPYLVAGDLVETTFLHEGCRCVRYHGRTAPTTGWLADRDLVMLRHDLPYEKRWTSEQIRSLAVLAGDRMEPPDFLGTWESACASVSIDRLADGTLRILSMAGVNDGDWELETTLHVEGNAAWLDERPSDATSCQLVLLRFNNALAAFENGWCGDRYCSYDGMLLPVDAARAGVE